MFICLLYNSEVVLNSQFTTYTEVIFVFSSQEGDFSIDSEHLRDGDTDACLTGEFSLGVNAINSDDSRACLDVVGSCSNFTFIANVDIGGGGGVVISSPTSISFDVDVGMLGQQQERKQQRRCCSDSRFEH